jgi:glycosyltransferase involved in cell wall biosynthesis
VLEGLALSTLSVILPALNEAENLRRGLGPTVDALAALPLDWEIVVVDDGSTDATWATVSEWHGRDPRVRGVRHSQNQGYGAALRTGFRSARHDRIFFTDADLQFDLRELPLLLRHADEHDIVAGYRRFRRDPPHRRLNAWAWGRLVDGLFDLGVRDVNCAFKLFRREVLEHAVIRSEGAFVNTEILARARASGFSVMQVPVTHYPRTYGEQTGARPRVVLRAFTELGRLYHELRGTRTRRRASASGARMSEPASAQLSA